MCHQLWSAKHKTCSLNAHHQREEWSSNSKDAPVILIVSTERRLCRFVDRSLRTIFYPNDYVVRGGCICLCCVSCQQRLLLAVATLLDHSLCEICQPDSLHECYTYTVSVLYAWHSRRNLQFGDKLYTVTLLLQ